MGVSATLSRDLSSTYRVVSSVDTDESKQSRPLAAAIRALTLLNRQYLAVLIDDGGVPDLIVQRLRGLPEDALTAAADCSFSLFTFGFEDRCKWQLLLGRAMMGLSSSLGSDSGDAVRAEFVATALFFVWHLVHTAPLVAKILTGIDSDIAIAMRAVPITQLHALAHHASAYLQPRWPNNWLFWAELVRYADVSIGAGQQSVRLLGRQLLAAETLGIVSAPQSVREVRGRDLTQKARPR